MELTRRSLEIGPFDIFGITFHPAIHWYGVIIVLGIIAATSLVAWLAKKDDEDPELVWNGVVWAVILGVVGARLWSVFFPAGDDGANREWSLDYITDLNDGPFAIWSGGLSIFGALLGGVVGVIIFARRHDLMLVPWIDRAVIAVPLAQAIGRWGNYINQELYGLPTDLPWGIQIDNPVPEYANDTHFHPLFLYESLGSLLLFGLLFYLWRNRRPQFQTGDFALIYLMGYGTIRFLLEFIRVEVPLVSGVNVSQVITGLAVAAALGVFILRRRTVYFVRETYPPFGETPKRKKKKKRAKKKV